MLVTFRSYSMAVSVTKNEENEKLTAPFLMATILFKAIDNK